jgi:sugar phosphate isomerase/epimerase
MAGAGHPRAKIALQLYTLRELTAAGMAPALQAVAGIGFTGVELAGLTDLSAAETAEECSRLGVEVCAAHVGLDRFDAEPEAVAEELRVLGTENVVFPWLPTPSSIVELEAACDRVAQATVRAASLGLAPHFHNHWGEFDRVSTGERLWDCLTAIHGLGLELDLGWAWSAGEQPEELLRANAGRCRLVHLKDLRRSGDEVSDTPLGDGDLDWPSIVPVALEVGAEWLIVEQDHPGEQPLAAVERSFTYLAEIL